jgi:tricorn protease
VPPDIEIELTPGEEVAGRDPQLERAVQEAPRLLEANPAKLLAEPAARVRRPGS